MKLLTTKTSSCLTTRIRVAVCLVFALATSLFANAQERVFLHFRQNDATWVEDYLRNNEIADSLSRLIDKMSPESVDSITVTAYSSPEGNSAYNHKLSQERAALFGELVSERFPELAGKVNVKAGGEAWALLRERVESDPQMGEALREQVLRILDDNSISNDTRKWRLANRLGDGNYRYLMDAHYRYLRCFEIVLQTSDNAKEEVIPEPAPLADQDTVCKKETVPITEPEPTPEPEPEPEPESFERKPVLAVSTNIPYDITYIPGYGITSIPSFTLEYYPSAYGHWSVGADVEFPMWRHWDTHKFMQIQNLTLHARYYLKKGDYRGLYALANVNAARYGIGWDAKGWEGEGLGVSAGIGYKITLYKRLFLDAGVALGYFRSRYDPYEYGFDATQRYYYDYVGLPEDFTPRNYALDWFGPTRVWIAIGIDLFGRKVKK